MTRTSVLGFVKVRVRVRVRVGIRVWVREQTAASLPWSK